jgi:hypothetical protein
MPDDARTPRSTRTIAMVHGALFHERYRDAVCPIYDTDTRGRTNLVGSVILLKLGPMRFAISGKSVFELLTDRSRIVGPQGPVDFGRPAYQFTHGASARADQFGVAWTPLAGKHIHGLGLCRYLSPGELEAGGRPDPSRAAGRTYVVLGFAARTAATTKPGVLAGQASFVMPALAGAQALYGKLGVAEHTHLLLDVDRKSLGESDGPSPVPGLRGLTGAVWSVPRDANPAQPAERLLGFFVDYDGGGIKTIVATRIGAAIDGIKKNFPQVREALEAK